MKKRTLIMIIVAIVAVLFYVFFVMEFPDFAHVKGGCDEDGLCVEPCEVQSLYNILFENC